MEMQVINQVTKRETLRCMIGSPPNLISSEAFNTCRYQKYTVGTVCTHSGSEVNQPWRALQDHCLPFSPSPPTSPSACSSPSPEDTPFCPRLSPPTGLFPSLLTKLTGVLQEGAQCPRQWGLEGLRQVEEAPRQEHAVVQAHDEAHLGAVRDSGGRGRKEGVRQRSGVLKGPDAQK